MARRRGLQIADADDVSQQVFASIAGAIESWERTDDGPPFRAWLTTIARTAITKVITRQPRDRATGTSSVAERLQQQESPGDADAELVIQTQREIVRWAAEQVRHEFTESTWDAFQKTVIDSIPVAEYANQARRSTGSVYLARFRVITRLKEKILETSHLWDVQQSPAEKTKP